MNSMLKKGRTMLTLLMTITFATNLSSQAEELKPIDQKQVTLVIDSIAKLVEKYYVSLEIGQQMGELIVSKNQKGAYANITDPNEFAKQLTSDLRSLNGDLHMSVHYQAAKMVSKVKGPSKYERNSTKGGWSNYGFQEVKVLDGNIGYLKINHFTQWNHFEKAKNTVDASFNFLQNTDALILDVRGNSGGFEEIVAYLISYLFEGDPIHLSDYYYRYQDKRHGIYTTNEIAGERLPNIPVYVLVDGRSASAAESLAYMLKHLKRATIIGETTMGAGNGAMTHKIDETFSVSIASETTINAVTNTSFEQVGVIPNVKTSGTEAFRTGYEMALNQLKKDNPKHIDPNHYEKLIEFLPKSEPKSKIDEASFEKYIGRYQDATTSIVISRNDHGLVAEIVGRRGKLNLIPREKHVFLVENRKERIEFVMNNKNKVIKLVGLDSPMELDKVK